MVSFTAIQLSKTLFSKKTKMKIFQSTVMVVPQPKFEIGLPKNQVMFRIATVGSKKIACSS